MCSSLKPKDEGRVSLGGVYIIRFGTSQGFVEMPQAGCKWPFITGACFTAHEKN